MWSSKAKIVSRGKTRYTVAIIRNAATGNLFILNGGTE
jgi:hypothetical protein